MAIRRPPTPTKEPADRGLASGIHHGRTTLTPTFSPAALQVYPPSMHPFHFYPHTTFIPRQRFWTLGLSATTAPTLSTKVRWRRLARGEGAKGGAAFLVDIRCITYVCTQLVFYAGMAIFACFPGPQQLFQQ